MGLLIKNGVINTSNKSYQADILIENEKIKEIGTNLNSYSHEIIDASNKYLMPGGIDVHTHMDLDLGNYRVVDNFYTGTVAAAYGGTTTIVDHIGFGPKNCNLQYQIDQYHKLAHDKSIIDYSFHGVFQHVNRNILSEIKNLLNEGITSFKLYMTYDNMLQDEEILGILFEAKKLGAVIAVHAENHGAIQFLRQYYSEQGKSRPIYHAYSRPDSSEAEAINRMIYLSEIAGYPHLYFVHVSTKKGLDEIISARKRGAKNIYCETCVQYLTLTQERYEEENNGGLKYIMSPPLRKKENLEALWNGIEKNQVDVIATDHCPFLIKDKFKGINDFKISPGGSPGVEERVELTLSEGIKRGISVNNLVDKLCTNPAKIFGLYPDKGDIQIGAHADIIIIKKYNKTIKFENRHSAVDYTPYEGFIVDYVVETIIQRGNIIVNNDKLLSKQGSGIFLKRERKGE
ncbi:MAG: dihydropyrimidinase [Tissierellia bacterium]|nr:dihydropyrimidinase [Tissierellia bacterium]